MAYTLSFLVSQGVDSTAFSLTDTSTGSDAAVVTRRITCTTLGGTILVPTGTSTTYIEFPFSDGASISVAVLPIDYAMTIRLDYINIAGTALYSLSQNYPFTGNDDDFDYSLTQFLVGNQSLLQDTTYVINRFTFRMLVDAASQAVTTGNDINSSQFLLDLAQDYVDNQTKYF